MNDHLKTFMQATTQADNACRELVRADLRKMIALAEQDQAIAGAKLSKAYNELQFQREPITALEAEIASAENDAQQWTQAHASDDLGARVAANVWQRQWSDEVARLRDKLSALQTSINPYETEHAKAKREFAEISGKVELLNANLYDPFIGFGPQTEAYKTYRCGYGSVIRVITLMNESAFEWGSAIAFLHELAALAGYDLVDNSDRLRKADYDELLKDYRGRHANDDRPESKVGKLSVEDSPVRDDYRFQPAKVPRKEMELPYRQ